MKKLLKSAARTDRRGLACILCLAVLGAVTSGVGTVMLVPMLGLLDAGGEAGGFWGLLAGLPYAGRAAVILCVFVGLMLLRAVLNSVSTLRQEAFLENYEMRLRDELYGRITRCAWEPLSRVKHTDLSNLLLTQCRQARLGLGTVLGMFSSAVMALLQLVIAFCLSPLLTAVVLAVGVAVMLLLRPFAKRSKVCGEEAVEANRAMFNEVHNQLGALKETRAYGVEAESERLFGQVSRRYYTVHQCMARLRVIPQMLYSVMATALIAAAFTVSVFVLQTDVTRLVVLVYIFSRLWPVFSTWQGQLQRIAAYLPAFERVCDMTERLAWTRRAATVGGTPLPFERELRLRDVHFRYQDGSENVLDGIGFSLPFGSVTALVGRSGTGKSTVADLLLGLLVPTGGDISVDGTVLYEGNADRWRRSIGYVPQSPLILDTTIRENLRRFHPDATEADMVRALQEAQAWEFVSKLSQGLDTVLGSKGVGLSGGEQQRLVLARVLMGAPRLVILDEATSALDYESESGIRRTIRTLAGKTTVLIIAHRFATIRCAERVIVLENGRITEEGAPEDLVKAGGYLSGMLAAENIEEVL